MALDIYHLYKHKKKLSPDTLPRIINMEPGGPNYTRQEMIPTHQSAVDSISSAFRLAIALHKIDDSISAKAWLEATVTIFMHQNKYELGPDRFNENFFIYQKLLDYLSLNAAALQQQAIRQQSKSPNWSLFHRRKDFIIDGVKDLRALAQDIWPECGADEQNNNIVKFISSRTHFPLINEKIVAEQQFQPINAAQQTLYKKL